MLVQYIMPLLLYGCHSKKDTFKIKFIKLLFSGSSDVVILDSTPEPFTPNLSFSLCVQKAILMLNLLFTWYSNNAKWMKSSKITQNQRQV